MSKTYVMTLRLPETLGREVERTAARQGNKAAQLGAWLVDEGIRRRKHPLIDLRETSAGRVAYVNGTRFAVYWVARQIHEGMSALEFARNFGLPPAHVRAALAYANAYPDEMEADADQVTDNMAWIREQDAAWRSGQKPTASRRPGKK